MHAFRTSNSPLSLAYFLTSVTFTSVVLSFSQTQPCYPGNLTDHSCLCQAVRFPGSTAEELRGKKNLSPLTKRCALFCLFVSFLAINTAAVSLQGCQNSVNTWYLIFWFHYLPLCRSSEDGLLDIGKQSSQCFLFILGRCSIASKKEKKKSRVLVL